VNQISDYPDDEVEVLPTKSLFVEMLTRDLLLDRAVLDLVDNSVDGARRLRPEADSDLTGLTIDVVVNKELFQIVDNCGGIGIDLARHYAFRIGRSKTTPRTPNSVGQFGVGMKRALFKFGHAFDVYSKTKQDSFELNVDVDAWENDERQWNFKFSKFEVGLDNPESDTGTTVKVSSLRENVANTFSLQTFQNSLSREIARTQQQYIDRGIRIKFNGVTCMASPWTVLQSQGLQPACIQESIDVKGESVHVRVFAGISNPNPREAGWYVFCNGRLILQGDQTNVTGWGKMAEDDSQFAPKYHNQFARFRGYVFFDAENAGLLPWNTTKTGVDEDAAIYQSTLLMMIESMRSVMEFLRRLDDEKDAPEEERPLTRAVAQAVPLRIKDVSRVGPFAYPERSERTGPIMTSIQYKRPRDQVQVLQDAIGARSAREVGELSFDLALQKYV
jgi:hypothetical protein